ncbi:cytochrome c family protein [Novosphingobium sp. AP12]|uniref:c-type cytochrome n=1 Tax=Novosphingobium sp. AP12 TaxID=1144305 RepID=UPI0002721A01|nr:c-type cytochrome [Novosphingobium sp. AP12]EJL27979.1 cytochrome c2 [Novosphingobium sp. AP12]
MTFIHRSALLLAVGLALSPLAALAEVGAVLFKTRCAACHATKPGVKSGSGPNLAGITGRPAAAAGYPYSPALKKSKIRWDARSLDTWLAGPSKMVPGTRMFTAVPKPADRQAIIAYLAAQNGK